VQPIIGFLQPAQLSGAQLPNVEAPVPTSRGGGGRARREEPKPLNVYNLHGFGRATLDVRDADSLARSMAERENIAGTVYIPYQDANSWKVLARAASGRDGARVRIGKVEFNFANPNWEEMVKNLREVFRTQDARAYTAAVRKDVIPYIEQLSAGLQNADIAPLVEAVRGFLNKHASQVGGIIQETIQQPNEFFSNFLQRLREYAQRKNLRTIEQALQSEGVREILRSALIAGIARYIASVHGAVEVNGVGITKPALKDGIIGLVLANLHLISP
jgi:hypothetical protein